MKLSKPYPGLYKDKDRQGRDRWRLRLPRRKSVTIKGPFGSPEFAESYRAAIEGEPEKRLSGKHGSFDALAASYLRSASFSNLAHDTRKSRRYWIENFLTQYGSFPVAALERRHVKKLIEAAPAGKARHLLSMIRVLMTLAIEDGIRSDDPTIGIKRPKLSAEGWHTWSEAEIAQFEAKHPIGSSARLAFALALYTGQRAADLVRMGRQHVRDGRINVAQQKTSARLWIPLHEDLTEIIDATPSEHLSFIVTENGKPYAHAQSFGNRMRRWCREAGLTGTPLHGLRKACCRRLAEIGCSVNEIAAISGHKSLAEIERYTKAADQRIMADRAIARTTTYPRAEQSYPQEKKS